jgi:hypothetical protein
LNKPNSFQKFLFLLLKATPFAVFFVSLDVITWAHHCDFKGDLGPVFIGFPFIYRTEIPWVCSMSGQFYLLGFVGNVILTGSLIALINVVRKKLRLQLFSSKWRMISWLFLSLLCLTIFLLNHLSVDWFYAWQADFKGYVEHPSFESIKEWRFLAAND